MPAIDQKYIRRLKILFGKDFVTSEGEVESTFLSHFKDKTKTKDEIHQFTIADTTLGDHNVDLDAANLWTGKLWIIKADTLTGPNVVNIIPNGSETIDGESSFIINTQQGAATLYSDGTDIHIVSFY